MVGERVQTCSFNFGTVLKAVTSFQEWQTATLKIHTCNERHGCHVELKCAILGSCQKPLFLAPPKSWEYMLS